MHPNDLPSAARVLHDNPSSVLFVTSQLRPRELKMADGLRQLGWAVGLVYYKWTPFDPLHYFDFAIEVASPSEAHEMAKQLAPRITHVFSGAIDDFVMLFCRDKPSRVVIDLNDVFAPSLFDYCHERFEPTREALALADGFCARDLQVKHAERHDGFTLPRHVLLFPEYCWLSEPPLAAGMPADGVHIVSVGTFSLETQGMYDSCYLQMAKLLTAQGIHLHIYPHWAYRRDHTGSPHANFERDFADFIALERSTPYLHLHDSLPIDELARVLPQYDFGIVSGGCAELGQKLAFYHRGYIETCYSGRISDYLDARLPVIVNDEVKFDYWLLKRHGVCVDLKGVLKPDFKQHLLGIKHDKAQKQMTERAVQALSVVTNSPRLAQFYENVLSGAAWRPPATAAPAVAVEVRRPLLGRRLLGKAWRALRWASPRVAKVALPYRAIRMFEVRLHNALIEIEGSRRRVRELDEQRERAEADGKTLLQRLESVEQEKRALQLESSTQATALHAKLSGLESVANEAQAQVLQLRQDLLLAREAHVVEVSALGADQAALHTRMESLEQERAALLRQVSELEHLQAKTEAQAVLVRQEQVVELSALQAEQAVLRHALSNVEQERNALCSQVTVLERLQQEQRERIAAAAAEAERLHGLLSAAEAERQSLLALMAQQARSHDELSVKLAVVEERAHQFEVRVLTAERDRQFLQERLEGETAERIATHVRLEESQVRSVRLDEQLLALEREKTSWMSSVVGLERDAAHAQAQLHALGEARTALHAQLEALGVDKVELRDRVSFLEKSLVAAAQNFESSERGRSELQQNLDAAERAQISLRQEISALTDVPEPEKLVAAAATLGSRLENAVYTENHIVDTAPKLLLACMPKSGSTWLTNVLAEQLGIPPVRCYLQADRNEQEIDPVVLFRSVGQPTLFVQQHVRYSRVSMRLWQAFSTKIVVLTRNLDDVVVSLRDHIENESPEWSMFYMESDWYRSMSGRARINFIIDHAIPWYINFFLGWSCAAELHPDRVLLVRYEDLLSDGHSVLQKISEFYGKQIPGVSVDALSKRTGTRFNQGRSGRGKEDLTEAHYAKLRRLVSHYPDRDFSTIGL